MILVYKMERGGGGGPIKRKSFARDPSWEGQLLQELGRLDFAAIRESLTQAFLIRVVPFEGEGAGDRIPTPGPLQSSCGHAYQVTWGNA
jgi:hypothetical protein